MEIIRRATDHSRTYTHSRYEESKDSRSRDYCTPKKSTRHRKRSRSSKKYSKYSSKFNSGTSERRFRDSSKEKGKRRDKKYDEKQKESDFKVPSKYSIASSEYKKRKDAM